MLAIVQILFESDKLNTVTFNITIATGFSVENKFVESHS